MNSLSFASFTVANAHAALASFSRIELAHPYLSHSSFGHEQPLSACFPAAHAYVPLASVSCIELAHPYLSRSWLRDEQLLICLLPSCKCSCESLNIELAHPYLSRTWIRYEQLLICLLHSSTCRNRVDEVCALNSLIQILAAHCYVMRSNSFACLTVANAHAKLASFSCIELAHPYLSRPCLRHEQLVTCLLHSCKCPCRVGKCLCIELAHPY